MSETAPPNMDLAAIRNRLAEESAVLFDDRTLVRRRKLVAGSYIRVRTRNGAIERITVGGTFFNPQTGREETVREGQKFKRSVRILTRQWKRIPDREREPLYEFLRKYASVRNTPEDATGGLREETWNRTCWIENPKVDGEELPGFWKMLRQFESRYRPQDPNDQGLLQTLMLKGDWELDWVPPGADDDGTEGDAAACVASSPLHHTDREIFLGASEPPSCEHRDDRGHAFEAHASFSDEDGTWEGYIDDDTARTPEKFRTWSGARYSKTVVISGTHEWETALPEEGDLDERLHELAGNKKGYYGTDYPLRDMFGRPRKADGSVPDAYARRPEEFSPLEYFEKYKYPDVMGYGGQGEAQVKTPVDGMGATVETAADMDNYGLFSTREHWRVSETRRFYMRDGGHIHDSWTYKGYKSAWLPVQSIDPGWTLQLSADLDEDGLFNFTKTINFAHPWEAWHAKKDEDSISVVFEFHNRKSSSVPNRSTAKKEGLKVLSKFGYKIDGNSLLAGNGLVSRDYDLNEYGMYDGKASYIFPFESVNMGTTATRNKFGETSRIHSWRNVPDGSFIEDDNRGYILKRTGKPDIVYARPEAGETLSFRKRLNDFGLYNITVQENDSYPEGFGEVYKYTTRKGRFQRNQTIIQDGREISEFRGYCYWADVEVKTFSNEKDANDFVSAGNSSEYNVVKGSGKWNDGSGVSYEGNGVWVGRKIIHHYSGEVPRNKEEVPR